MRTAKLGGASSEVTILALIYTINIDSIAKHTSSHWNSGCACNSSTVPVLRLGEMMQLMQMRQFVFVTLPKLGSVVARARVDPLIHAPPPQEELYPF